MKSNHNNLYFMNLFLSSRSMTCAVAVFALLLTACNTTKQVQSDTDSRVLDTVYVQPEAVPDVGEMVDMPYRGSYDRPMDLVHTDLSVSFDMTERSVIGEALLKMAPTFYDQNSVQIDAKGFDLHKVSSGGQELKYAYDGNVLDIVLDKTYEKGEELNILIDYTAYPYRGDAGGSAAINSARGLYFIDPLDTDPYKPTQIWTQGETESSSRWFPTMDKPNERHTHVFKVRVPNQYRTLSNGALTDQESHTDGTRTDTWTMDASHAPYLAMLAIGEFHTEEAMWKKVPLEYIVEPPYAEEAAMIFNHTPEMLTFFSDVLDYPYPWNKYSQVVVRDYVSGAMENTTASLYGQQLQRPKGDLIDNGNDRIVAHEMFHHWFGDLVTCESWSNLTLNEGFANYSEYLWMAHKYGEDIGDWHRYNEFQGYLGQAQQQVHPLIDFHYADKEDMFDAHSYNKGGMVLHMLRQIVGDEAFFEALNDYLHTMAYKAAEVHDLRLAFERVTGLDLNGFFNQWFLSPGHPELMIETQYLAEQGMVEITVDQKQLSKGWPMFELHTEVMIVKGAGSVVYEPLHIDEASKTTKIAVDGKPLLVLVDPHHDQLATISYTTAPDLASNYEYLVSIWDRMEALNALSSLEGLSHEALVSKGLKDEAWPARERAVNMALDGTMTDPQYRQIARSDDHAKVRAAAIQAVKTPSLQDINLWAEDESTIVQSAAAMRLLELEPTKAKVWAEANEGSRSLQHLAAVAHIYATTEAPDKLAFFSGPALDALSGYEERFAYYGSWGEYLASATKEEDMFNQTEQWVEQLTNEDTDLLSKYSVLTAIGAFSEKLDKDALSEEGKTKMGGLMAKVGMAASKLMQG